MKHMLVILAFMAVSFGAQGLSHFVINKAHFADISFARADPIIPLGLFVMVVQGAIMSIALHAWKGSNVQVVDGVLLSMVFGVFLVSYIALVEPAKYAVPSVIGWMRVEIVTGAIQFALFGVLLGTIHSKWS